MFGVRREIQLEFDANSDIGQPFGSTSSSSATGVTEAAETAVYRLQITIITILQSGQTRKLN